MASFLSFLLGEKKKTASVAKERLQIILAHERSGRNAAEPDYLPALQRELVAVISKYVKINPEDLKVSLERQDNLEVLEVKIELPIEAHLPHDYVQSERLRLEMYKRLADVRALAEVDELRAELVDRYGEPPEAVDVLLEVARLRVRVRDAGLTEVTSAGPNIRFAPLRLADSAQMRLARIYPAGA